MSSLWKWSFAQVWSNTFVRSYIWIVDGASLSSRSSQALHAKSKQKNALFLQGLVWPNSTKSLRQRQQPFSQWRCEEWNAFTESVLFLIFRLLWRPFTEVSSKVNPKSSSVTEMVLFSGGKTSAGPKFQMRSGKDILTPSGATPAFHRFLLLYQDSLLQSQ